MLYQSCATAQRNIESRVKITVTTIWNNVETGDIRTLLSQFFPFYTSNDAKIEETLFTGQKIQQQKNGPEKEKLNKLEVWKLSALF